MGINVVCAFFFFFTPKFAYFSPGSWPCGQVVQCSHENWCGSKRATTTQHGGPTEILHVSVDWMGFVSSEVWILSIMASCMSKFSFWLFVSRDLPGVSKPVCSTQVNFWHASEQSQDNQLPRVSSSSWHAWEQSQVSLPWVSLCVAHRNPPGIPKSLS